MQASTLTVALLSALAPLLIFASWARRPQPEDGARGAPPRGRRLLLVALVGALGAALYAAASLFEAFVARWAGLDDRARAGADVAAMVFAFFVAAPLEQGLKVLAVVPAWRSRSFALPRDGVLFAGASALGFVTARDVALFLQPESGATEIVRALLAVPAHVFFGAAWGYALGREAASSRGRRLGGRAFNITWLVATVFNGVYDRLVYGRSAAALWATTPILLVMVIVVLIARRSLGTPDSLPARARPRRLVIAPPSLGAVRAALWRTEQPVMFGWIGAGALVTVGVITSALAAAVMLGRRLGLDFAAVDRGDGSSAGVAPLLLLGAAALAAFPVAGYLVARASSSRSVLESAIAAALAIAGALVLLGLAAPVAVVFALAFAPIALALACVGAWMGITR